MGIPFNPDFNGASQEGVGYYQLTQRDARRSSTSAAYLKPIRGRTNLTVRTGVQVTRIVVEKGRAIGVEIVDGPAASNNPARRARGDRHLGRDRLAQAAAAIGHRPGRSPEVGRRDAGA